MEALEQGYWLIPLQISCSLELKPNLVKRASYNICIKTNQ